MMCKNTSNAKKQGRKNTVKRSWWLELKIFTMVLREGSIWEFPDIIGRHKMGAKFPNGQMETQNYYNLGININVISITSIDCNIWVTPGKMFKMYKKVMHAYGF